MIFQLYLVQFQIELIFYLKGVYLAIYLMDTIWEPLKTLDNVMRNCYNIKHETERIF